LRVPICREENDVTTTDIAYEVDGSTMIGRLAVPVGEGTELVGVPGIEYHQPSDERSWRAMIDLFDEVFA
jgi:hypothetical protein